MTRNKFIILTALILASSSCTKDFERINVNPNLPSTIPLDYQLTNIELLATGVSGDPGHKMWRTSFFYASTLMQQFARLGGGYAGDKYQYDAEAYSTYWNDSYPASIKNEVDLIARAKADPANVNILSMARVLKVYDFHRMTDLYGDVPYSEAGLGYLEQTFSPKYDLQKDIYMDMLKELEQSAAAFDATKPKPTTADIIYGGDVVKWKKFANSLMLRLGMRLQKVDASTAQTWVAKALAGGVMTSRADAFTVAAYSNPANPFSYNLGAGRGEIKLGVLQWSKTFIDKLKARTDPRLGLVAVLPPLTSAGAIDQSTEGVNGDRTPANQRGLPNGLDGQNTASPANDLQAQTGQTNLTKFSRPAASMYGNTDPNFAMTYAEVKFLTAEAIERGWATGSAAAEYAAGQSDAIKVLAGFQDAQVTISDAQIIAYQAANPYPAGSVNVRVEQIQTELWVLWATTFNNIEAWSSWRRTGYPVLTPVVYPGNVTGGTIPRRLIYSTSDGVVNLENQQAAIARLTPGTNELTSRVWWDKP